MCSCVRTRHGRQQTPPDRAWLGPVSSASPQAPPPGRAPAGEGGHGGREQGGSRRGQCLAQGLAQTVGMGTCMVWRNSGIVARPAGPAPTGGPLPAGVAILPAGRPSASRAHIPLFGACLQGGRADLVGQAAVSAGARMGHPFKTGETSRAWGWRWMPPWPAWATRPRWRTGGWLHHVPVKRGGVVVLAAAEEHRSAQPLPGLAVVERAHCGGQVDTDEGLANQGAWLSAQSWNGERVPSG